MVMCCAMSYAAAVTVEPGNTLDFVCPRDALRSVRQAVGGSESTLPAPQGVGRAPFRIAIWGDSHTASAFFIDAMLAAMHIDLQTALPTFLPATWTLKGVAQPLRVSCSSLSWRTVMAHQGARAVGAGLMAISSEQQGDLLAFDFRWPKPTTRIASIRLHLSKKSPERTLVLGVSADGGPEAIVSVEGDAAAPITVELSRPAATLQLRLVAGEVTIHGLSPNYVATAQNHLDVFSIPGATVEGWRHADVRGVAFAGSRPPLDLAILQYGTNDAPNADLHPEEYKKGLQDSLRQFRLAYPGTRCVLIGPPDRGGRGPLRDFSLVHNHVSRIQQQLAQEHRCEFWDWQWAMGGLRSAANGAARTPPTVQPDLTHLTALGYRQSGQVFGTWAAKLLR